MSYEIKVVRFELWPADEPTAYCVGFTGVCNNGRSVYQDTQVSLGAAKDKTDEEIVALAWEKISKYFTATIEATAAKPPILGQTWTPPEVK